MNKITFKSGVKFDFPKIGNLCVLKNFKDYQWNLNIIILCRTHFKREQFLLNKIFKLKESLINLYHILI